MNFENQVKFNDRAVPSTYQVISENSHLQRLKGRIDIQSSCDIFMSMSPTTKRKLLTREESRAQTRERLIEAAKHLFVANGYGGASIRDIANQAGYSQGAFYSNFLSKEEVLLELLRRHMGAQTTQLSALMKNQQTPQQMLAHLESWAGTLNHDADWCTLSIELQLHAYRSPGFAVEYQKVWDAHRSDLGAVIGQLFDKLGRIPSAAPDELATGFMALSHGLALQRVATHTDSSGRLIMVLLRGLISNAEHADKASASIEAKA